jgi:hypothetical protein
MKKRSSALESKFVQGTREKKKKVKDVIGEAIKRVHALTR